MLDYSGNRAFRWPDVDPDGFVHVSEATRALSPALETAFLPVRRYIMSRYLCQALTDVPPAAEPEPVPEAQEMLLVQRNLPVEQVTEGIRYVDQIIDDYMAGAVPAAPTEAEAALSVRAAVQGMTPAARNALRVRIEGAIDVARTVERQRPGAFVETRRPH